MPFDPVDDGMHLDGGGRPNHRKIIKPNPAPLDVVAVVSNPFRYRSRYDLYRQFEKHILESGARLTTVELAYGNRPFEILDLSEPRVQRYVQLRTEHEIWHKENLINIGVSCLPRDWQYVAWIDADIQFVRTDWVQETLQLLQHYYVVQLWSHAQDLGPRYEPLDRHSGFVYCYQEHPDIPRADVASAASGPGYSTYAPHVGVSAIPGYPGTGVHFWHPGFAWATRRDIYDKLGGLIDWAPLGAGDHHMAKALIGRVDENTARGLHPAYYSALNQWQDRALRWVRKNIGYVPGTINHYWHGLKKHRRYWDRWQILVKNQFDPVNDLKKDWQGVWQLVDDGSDRSISLRDDIRNYFRHRNEDHDHYPDTVSR